MNFGHWFEVRLRSTTQDMNFTMRETHQRNLTETLGYVAKFVTQYLGLEIKIPPVRTFIHGLDTFGYSFVAIQRLNLREMIEHCGCVLKSGNKER